MNLLKHLDKNNLHHAYLIEGEKEKTTSEILSFLAEMGIVLKNNPDFYHFSIDIFKIDDAKNLKSLTTEKSFNLGKKIFLISTNNFLLEAQNTLLKIFEEPANDVHFFIIVPNANIFLKTLFSRFYFIKTKNEQNDDTEIENFLSMSLSDRINFCKEFLKENKEENEDNIFQESVKSRSLKFLNSLEAVLHQKYKLDSSSEYIFNHFMKVREFLKQPGSASKTLLESISLIVPILK